ncbi:MAG: TPM domain-containing protein [Candidatus Omnitrophota bacterium]
MTWHRRFLAGWIAVFLAGFLPIRAHAQFVPIPEASHGYISDNANLISSTDRRKISQLAAELEKKTTAQIAVVTLPTTLPESIQGYSVRLYDKWKIGQKGKDNGVLLLIAVDDRQAWITTGYGLEGALPDVICGKIVNETIIPFFKRGQFSEGISAGAVAIMSLVAKEYGVTVTGQETEIYAEVHRQPSGVEQFFGFLLTVFLTFIILGTRTGFLTWFLLGSLGHRRGGYWYGSGSHGSSGGFGGGFGGFGGGMTGGGGGGGRW